MTSETFHYPPELIQGLIEALSRVNKSKMDVLTFFRGAGTPRGLLLELEARVRQDRDSISKAEIARTLIVGLNEGGDATLRARRELLKRVTEIEDYSGCWEADRDKAELAVRRVRDLVNVKDTFRKMDAQRETAAAAEALARRAAQTEREEAARKRDRERATLLQDFLRVAGDTDAHRRGKALERVVNDMFRHAGILIREDFCRRDPETSVTVEQIDGIVEIGQKLYLVELKWLKGKAEPGDVGPHLVRVFTRGDVGGIFVSANGYSPGAIDSCRDALVLKSVVLVDLATLVLKFESGTDLGAFLNTLVQRAQIEKHPYPIG